MASKLQLSTVAVIAKGSGRAVLLMLAAMSGAEFSCTSSGRSPVVSSGVESAGGRGGNADAASGGTAPSDAGSDRFFADAGTVPADSGFRETPDGPTDAGCVSPTVTPIEADGGRSVCPVSENWGTGVPVLAPSTPDLPLEDDVLGSITYDELTVAWLSLADGVPTLHYADRSASTDAFGSPQTIFLTADYYAVERPAVSPDGLRIVLVRSDRKGFGEYSRTMQFAPFTDLPSEAGFYDINRQGLMLTENEHFGDPLISSDDRTFYYSRYDGVSSETIFASTRTDDVPWLLGSPVLGSILRASCGHRMRPTGISSDQLTLFYWDEVSGSERATFRPSMDAPFAFAIDLGPRDHAQPNQACSRLYYSGASSGPGQIRVSSL